MAEMKLPSLIPMFGSANPMQLLPPMALYERSMAPSNQGLPCFLPGLLPAPPPHGGLRTWNPPHAPQFPRYPYFGGPHGGAMVPAQGYLSSNGCFVQQAPHPPPPPLIPATFEHPSAWLCGPPLWPLQAA
jgi:hypothetical protein